MKLSNAYIYLGLFLESVAAFSVQWPLGDPGRFPAPDSDALFTPLEDLSLVPDEQHIALKHPAFPKYTIRIKKSHDFCDPTVNSYTGYLDIEARHIFFYFFESRNDPEKDDVIFWTNGGPGCSSAVGLFMELGPCKLKDDTTVPNPYSWNTNANIFFVDQPIGVGFSYADYGEQVSSTEEAAKDIASFVAIFFEHFVKFKGRAFHMAGESYGGRYLPLFASEIYDQNARLAEAGLAPVNLQSVMIGNGLTDMMIQLISNYQFACEAIAVPPVLSIDTCVKLKQKIPRCNKWVQASCIDKFDRVNCGVAYEFCLDIWEAYYASGMNPYDIRLKCDGKVEETLCYAEVMRSITSYLSNPLTLAKLGVDPYYQNFTTCNEDINTRFWISLDFAHQTQLYVSALLERGVRVLTYVGNYDWICNWVGVEAWTLALEWSGKMKFGEQELRVWEVDRKQAGVTRSAGGFTFATIDGAGHMAPYDQPKESLALVQRWLAGEEI